MADAKITECAISFEYAAGFFDGEGSVYAAARNHATLNRFPTILVCIGNTNLEILEAHKSQFGGSIGPRRNKSERHRPQWQWVLSARGAEPYLRGMLPHLRIKRKVAELALQYLDLQAKPHKERFDYGTVFRRGRYWVSFTSNPDHRAALEKIHSAIREENRRGAPFNAMRGAA